MSKATLLVFILLVPRWQMCFAQPADTNYTCDNGNYSCTACFNRLVFEAITSSGNQYAMQNAFFPSSHVPPPVYLIVHYEYDGMEETNVWFWTTSTYYALFHPLHVHQFTSLFFSDPEFRTAELTLTLPAECYDANSEFMRLLTSRVRKSSWAWD